MASPVLDFLLTVDLSQFRRGLSSAITELRSFSKAADGTLGGFFDPLVKGAKAAASAANAELSKIKTPSAAKVDPGVAKQAADQRKLAAELKKTEQAFNAEAAAARKAGQDGAAAGGKLSQAFNSIKEKLAGAGGGGGGLFGGTGIESLTSKIPGLSGGLSQITGIIGKIPPVFLGVAAAAVAVGVAFKGLLDIGEKFHKAFATIRVGTGATGESLHKLETQFKATFSGTADGDIGSLSKTFADLNTQTGLTGKPLDTLTKQFAALEKFGDAPTIRSFTRHLGDFGVPADKASAALDKIFVASQATGVPMGRLSDLLTQFGAPLRNFGFSVEEGTALLANFEKTGVNTELVMGSLRIASGKFAREGKDLKAGLFEAITAIKGVGSSSEATALAMKTFGARAGADMADTIRGGKFEIEGFINSLKGSKETILGARADISGLGGSFEKLNRKTEVALQPLGELAFGAAKLFESAITGILNPLVDGLSAVVTGFVVPLVETIIDRVSRIGDAIGSIFSAFGSLGGQAEGLGSAWSKIGDIISFLGTLFLGLQQIITEAIVAPIEIGADIIGQIVEFIGDISTGGQGAAGAWTGFNGILNGAKLSLSAIIGFISGIKDAFASVKDGISEGFSKLLSGDILGAIGSVKDGITGAVEGIGDSIDAAVNDQLLSINVEEGKKALEEKLKISKGLDLSKSVAELRAQLAAAGTDAERADIGAKLAATVPKAVTATKQVTDEFGNVTTQIEFAEDKLDKFVEKSNKAATADHSGQQIAIIDGLNAQIRQQQLAEEEAKKLSDTLAQQKVLHGENSEEVKKAQVAFDNQAEKVKEGSTALSEFINTTDGSGAFKNLAPAAQAAYDKAKVANEKYFQDAKDADGIKELAATLQEAATLQGDLDKNGTLPELVNKFNAAKTQIEKDSIAKSIEAQVPGAISQIDRLGHATEINTDRVLKYADANGRAYSGKTLELQEKFKKGLNDQADTLAKSEDEVTKLTAKFNEYGDKGQKAPKEVQEALEKARKKVEENTKALDGTVASGKKFGLLKGTASEVGTEFGKSARNVAAVESSMERAAAKTEDLSDGVAKIGEEFEKLRKGANEALNTAINEAAGLALKFAQNQQEAGDKELLAAARLRARNAVLSQKQLDDLVEQEEQLAGKKKVERAKIRERLISHVGFENFKLDQEKRLGLIKDEIQLEIAQYESTLAIAKKGFALSREEVREQARVASANEKDKAARAAIQAQATEKIRLIDVEQKKAQKARDDAETALRLKLTQNGGIELLKKIQELEAARGALYRDSADSITENDISSIQDRQKLLTEAIRIEGEAKIQAATIASTAFKEILETEGAATSESVASATFALAAARLKLSEGQATQADVDAAEAALAASQKRQAELLTQIREGFIDKLRQKSVDGTITADQKIILDQLEHLLTLNAGIVKKQTLSNEKELADAVLRTRLASITSAGEKERELKLIEIAETLRAELSALADADKELERQVEASAARRAAIEADTTLNPEERASMLAGIELVERTSAQRRADITIARAKAEARASLASLEAIEKYEREKNIILDAGLGLQESLLSAFNIAVTDDEKKAAEERAASRRKETADLRQQLSERKISEKEYYAAVAKIQKESLGERVKFSQLGDFFERKLKVAALTFAARLEETGSKRTKKGQDDLELGLEARRITTAKRDKAISEGRAADAEQLSKDLLAIDDANTAARESIMVGSALKIGGVIADLLLTQQATFQNITKAVLGIAFDFLQAMVPVWVAQYVGGSLATPQSILSGGTAGIIQFTAFTALLESAVGTARAIVNGFAEGVVSLSGPGTGTSDSIPARLSRGESVITARGTTTGKNSDALRWLNRTGGDLRDWQNAMSMPTFAPMHTGQLPATGGVIQQLEAQTAELATRVAGVESAVLGVKTAVSNQRLSASTVISGEELRVLVDRKARAAAR